MSSRIIVWFSCGAASAVAAKLVLSSKTDEEEIVIARNVIDSEHEDNDRFARDCEVWFGQQVINLRSEKYKTHWEVLEDQKFIGNHAGAPCTAELKKIPRYAFQRVDDIQVFGYTSDEKNRATRLQEQNPEVTLRYPLIDAGLSKNNCYALIQKQGIRLPAMYELGYNNNNCIGCAKATSVGYWNRIRRTHPDAFARMAKLQRELNYTQIVYKGNPMFLDKLNPRIRESKEPVIECSLLCWEAEEKVR